MKTTSAALAALALAALAPCPARANPLTVVRAHAATMKLDVAEARALLASQSPDDPSVATELALLAVYEGDCDTAVELLRKSGLEAQQAHLADVARGCARVTAATTVLRDENRGISIRFKDDEDAVLAPFLFDVAERSMNALERDLKVRLPRPLRIEIVRDHYSLAAMTGLPEEAAATTGTVAIAKWGRVTMLTPRAMPSGYAWADTLMHELTHLSVTRASLDRAPLWLQEGVAKRQETRWRSPLPFDDQPPPDALARLGFERGLALPLDRLGPSIAMLPSAEQAMIAFAEVNSFLRFWIRESGEDALAKLLPALADAPGDEGINTVLTQQTGAPLAAWSERWQRYLASTSQTIPPDLMPSLPPPRGKAPPTPPPTAPSRDVYRNARLAELLSEREHHQQALGYARKTHEAVPADPSARARLAVLLRALGRDDEASGLTASLDAVHTAHGLYLTLHGVGKRTQTQEQAAQEALFHAVGLDPYNPRVACELNAPGTLPAGEARAALCEHTRRR